MTFVVIVKRFIVSVSVSVKESKEIKVKKNIKKTSAEFLALCCENWGSGKKIVFLLKNRVLRYISNFDKITLWFLSCLLRLIFWKMTSFSYIYLHCSVHKHHFRVSKQLNTSIPIELLRHIAIKQVKKQVKKKQIDLILNSQCRKMVRHTLRFLQQMLQDF